MGGTTDGGSGATGGAVGAFKMDTLIDLEWSSMEDCVRRTQQQLSQPGIVRRRALSWTKSCGSHAAL